MFHIGWCHVQQLAQVNVTTPLKALSMGAKAVGVGHYYLFPLAAAGQKGVEHSLQLMRDELVRDMRLMGCRSIAELSRANLQNTGQGSVGTIS